jgi:hypothetical protein
VDEQRAGTALETGVNSGATQGTTIGARGAAGLVTLGRLPAADIETWSKALTDWSRNPEIYGVIINVSSGAALEAGTGSDSLRSLYSLIWKLNCFTKPAVTLLSSDTPPWVMALAVAGTHQVASAGCYAQNRDGPASMASEQCLRRFRPVAGLPRTTGPSTVPTPMPPDL